jgi:6-phosphogluconolactonase
MGTAAVPGPVRLGLTGFAVVGVSLMKTRILLPVLTLVLALPCFVDNVRSETWHVYFGTGGPGARGIYRAEFDTETGRLRAADLAAEIGSPGFLALHPDGDKLYAVANFAGGPGAVGYRIGGDGSLDLINSSPTGDGGGAHIAVHPSGKFLLTAQYGGGSTALFPLDAEGRLGAATLSRHEGGSRVVPRRQENPHPHWCGFSPDGRFALVPDLGMDGIVIYRVDLDGPAIERHGFAASVPGGGPRHMRFSPDGRFIYLLNELSLSVTAFAWDAAAGTARQLATVPSLSEEVKAREAFNSAAEIVVHPSGRFVYSSNRGHDTVTVYRADPATAALEVIQVQPIRGAFPRNINLAPGAGWLLAAGADSNTVAVHRVDGETGELTYQTRGIINVPAPICIVFAK